MLHDLLQEFKRLENPTKAVILARFFKTGEGQYGAGDTFLGLTVPLVRILAKRYKTLSLTEIEQLLQTNIHEYRLTALFILIFQFQEAQKQKDTTTQQQIFDFYLTHTTYINNRDLIDLSAPKIIGAYLLDKDTDILYKLAKSESLREKRIAIIATFAFIKEHMFDDTLAIAEILLHDTHDLIHKAVGRMLREAGKRCVAIEEEFLQDHYKTMPRTMLRYAIEKFPEEKRQQYLKGLI